MKQVVSIALAVSALIAALPASAQFQKPEDAVKYRQSALSLMGTHFSRLGAMANGRVPFDAKVAQDNAALVETLSKLPWPAFVAGSDKVSNTKAKPEIWSDHGKFTQASENMMAEVAKLSTVAKTGNLDQIKVAFGNAAASCKACHDNFRQ
jgi:cytochrome c556